MNQSAKFFNVWWYTLPETNMAPENNPLEKEITMV